MLRMILADDEPVITRGIKKLIDWEQLGITIIGEYDNGNSAMENILAQKPDIALLDISMPGMTGMEILKDIHRLQLPTKVIYISGFQDFEYVRTAITYGAVDYLLKPVIREELLRAVEKAVLQISGEKIKTESGAISHLPTEQNKESVILENSTYIPVFADILFDGSESAQEERLITFSFVSFLEEYLAEKDLGILFTKDEHIVMVLKGIHKDKAKLIVVEIWKEACNAIGKKAAFVIGGMTENMKGIPEEYEKCLEMSRYFFFENQIMTPVLVVGEAVFSRQVDAASFSAAREQIVDAIFAQDKKAFQNAFELFSKNLCLISDGRKEDACYDFCFMVRLIEEKLYSMNLEEGSTSIKRLLAEGRECNNFVQMKEIFRNHLEGYLTMIKNVIENNEKKDIFRAKEYIEKHYKENLTLEVLAGEIHMNPYYFSSYFKKNAGENFKDYVNSVRIRHAVSLLVSTDMKAYEIAAEVGFRDVRSFTEVFSRTYGETPNAYRKRVIGKED